MACLRLACMRCLPTTLVLWFGLFLEAGCVNQLPPAATPDPVAPSVGAMAPPAEGHGRLVLDVVDGPTAIHRVNMDSRPMNNGKGQETFWFSESYRLLCDASPCVADLPIGNVLLGFPVLGDRDGLEIELVHVSAEPTVYRRALSYHEGGGAGFVLGILGTAFGGASAATGITFLPIGLANDDSAFTTAGAITLGVGSALIALGIWGILADRPLHRAGASAHFPLVSDTPSGDTGEAW